MNDSTSPDLTQDLPAPARVILCAGERGMPVAEYRHAVLSAFQGHQSVMAAELEDALRRAAAGDRDVLGPDFRASLHELGSAGSYLAGADDLGIEVKEFYDLPPSTPEDELSAALHTLVVVLVSRPLTGMDGFVDWIDRCAGLIAADQTRHRLLILDLDSSLAAFFGQAVQARWSQAMTADRLGEHAIRPTVTALVALHRCLQAVTDGSAITGNKMRLFVSHAKLDGQPLARALTDMIETLPGFQGFYDAADIPWGSDWGRVLEDGVRDSVVIALRSDIYETRDWCVQEMRWADQFSSPVVVVDLRNTQITPPGQLNFDRATTLRIPDGNLFRVIFVAVREGLRARLHVRIVQHMIDAGRLYRDSTEVIVRHPTMNTLRAVCERSRDRPDLTILYPDPQMHIGDLHAASALVASYSPNFRLATPETLMTLDAGGRP